MSPLTSRAGSSGSGRTVKKSWRGSDLVFDIDYDHLKRPTLREAKKQSEKLLVILKDDLGFRKLLYVDSGSRGFHVHVHDKCVQKLGNPERREIADFFGHYKTKRGRKIINPNWNTRLRTLTDCHTSKQ